MPSYPGQGYFTSLSVKKTSCRVGRKLVLAYYRCRIKAGRAGHCAKSRVMRYHCAETRVAIPTELDGRVTCTRGHRKIVHTYEQVL